MAKGEGVIFNRKVMLKIFMVFHGFGMVSMVFQGGFMVFHSFWLVSMVFQGGFMVFGRFPWLMVPGWLNPS